MAFVSTIQMMQIWVLSTPSVYNYLGTFIYLYIFIYV